MSDSLKHYLKTLTGASFTCCGVDGNFRNAALLIAWLCIVPPFQMALYTGPGVKKQEERRKRKPQSVRFAPEETQKLFGKLKFNESSITDTVSTKKSQCWSLITVFPRLHSASITLLCYNSAIKWHSPWQLLYNGDRKSLSAVLGTLAVFWCRTEDVDTCEQGKQNLICLCFKRTGGSYSAKRQTSSVFQVGIQLIQW